MSFDLVEYSDRSLAIFGDTKAYKEELKNMGGKFNYSLTYNDAKCPGWIFKKDKYDDLVEFIENLSITENEEEKKPIASKIRTVKKTGSASSTPKKAAPKPQVKKIISSEVKEVTVSAAQFKQIKKKTVHHVLICDTEYYRDLNPGDKLIFSNGEDMTISRKIISVHKVLNTAAATALHDNIVIPTVEDDDEEEYVVILEF